MKNDICILEEWCDDDGIVSFEKPIVFASYRQAEHNAFLRMMDFLKNDKMCRDLDIEIPTERRFGEILVEDGYFVAVIGEGSTDYRKYYRIVEVEQTISIAQ